MRFAILRILVWCGLTLCPLLAADYRAPAGIRPAIRRPGAESILPGGRMIAPLGRQFITGPGPFGLAVSPNGKTIVTANGGPRRYSFTLVRRDEKNWDTRQVIAGSIPDDDDVDFEWTSVFMGLAFSDDKTLFGSEGNSGRVRVLDPATGKKRYILDINTLEFRDSYSGDLAIDTRRDLLYVVDQANFRIAVFNIKNRRLVGSVRVGRMPFAVALSPNGQRLYVTNVGMFEYKQIPGTDRSRSRDTGLPFPAFGFPSPEALSGAGRLNASWTLLQVPGLGDPNAPESNSLAVVNVENPAAPKLEKFVRTGLPFGEKSLGGSSPSGVTATADRIFVTNAHNDSVTVVAADTLEVKMEIPLRIHGLESLRGVMPIGLTYHEPTGWLYVAEAGINAIGIIDTRQGKVLGHLPAGWFPTKVAIDRDTVYVTNAKGHGTGPNATGYTPKDKEESFQLDMRRGSLSAFPLPRAGELSGHTTRVLSLNGFISVRDRPHPLPKEIRHVVIIVKENRTFDEVFGDIASTSNGNVAGMWDLARFGRYGNVYADPKSLRSRFSLRSVNVTPNHHEIATRWAFSDNFYADSEMSVDGHHWLVGSYPNPWVESSIMSGGKQKDFRLPTSAPGRLRFFESNSSVLPDDQLEAGTLWHHLERHKVSFYNFGEGFELAGIDEGKGLKPTGGRFLTNVPMPEPLFRNSSREYPGYNTNIPDQYRASQFIAEADKLWGSGGQPLPQLLFIHLPNDHMAKPRPEDGYPFQASYVADNDYALGRILEYLSHTSYWKNMAVLITEDDAQGGVDHVDSHRTVMMVAGPYAKRNYVSHTHSSFPGLLKTAFRILGLPPLNLYDAAASDLADCFTSDPDFTPYEVKPIQIELFDPLKAREPLDPHPVPRMDDPRTIREQHRERER